MLSRFILILLSLGSISAATVVFEHLPQSLSNFVSHHAVGGPVLADDFDPSEGGAIILAEWWGSAAGSSDWELTFHTGTTVGGVGQPAVAPVLTGGTKFMVTSVGIGIGGGLFYYSAAIPAYVVNGTPGFGSEYWFSVANFADGWTWALAGAGPSVGDEHWSSVQSLGTLPCGDGGPHCGAWVTLPGRDFAFRLSAVPEPASLFLMGVGLVVLGKWHQRRRSA